LDYVRRSGGIKVHGNKGQVRKPDLEGTIEFYFELGEIKYTRTGHTIVQILIPFEFGEANLLLQRATGLLLKAAISKVPLTEDDVSDT
jgi:hypothetical protein